MIGPSMIPTNNELIIEWVGTSKETILDSIFNQGEWYKLLTPILFHSGFIHLIINILIQLQIGYQFECEWGSCIWIIIYILGAVGSTLISLKLLPNAEFISIGSSGAIMGLFGVRTRTAIQ
jgi:membrane associated rhomboid family serine protease